MVSNEAQGELREWLAKLTEDMLTADEQQALTARLREDPEARAFYRRYIAMEALLDWEYTLPLASAAEPYFDPARLPDDDTVVPETTPAMQGWFNQKLWPLKAAWRYGRESLGHQMSLALLVAAVITTSTLVLLAIFAAPNFRRWVDSASPERAEQTACTGHITATVDVRWADKARVYTTGDTIKPDLPLQLAKGLVEFTFQSGTKVIIEGPAEFVPQNGNQGRLTQGTLLATVPKQAVGFKLATAHATIVDLGTQFGVWTAHDIVTRVNVLEGQVEIESLGHTGKTGKKTKLAAGAAVRISAGEDDTIEQDRFAPKPYRSMMSAVAKKTSAVANTEGLLVYEGFSYPVRSKLHEKAGGFGFGGTWQAPDALVAGRINGSLAYPAGVALQPQGGRVAGMGRNDRKETILRRTLAPETWIDFDVDRDYYVSFLLRRSLQKDAGGKHIALQLRNDTGSYLALALNGNGFFWICGLGTSPIAEDRPVKSAATYFLTAKIDANAGDATDFAYLNAYRVDGPEPDRFPTEEPQQWQLTASGKRHDCINNIAFVIGPAPGIWEADELRIGTSWKAIAGEAPPRSVTARPTANQLPASDGGGN